ncbi:hypothetical protein FACS1894139_04530 [Planctomycetales bacterium]|nr:hypothetical protein FACS1894107_09190 [Planctomycetales bacterium]GHS99066.1 hypothetical protein FACS1894108_08370 [Planctomycetales bacterium]GHT03677.1 hypothetical protein FACS1894139_04530 [Planctomycetales bacterium]
MYYCQRMFVEYERVLSYPKFNFAAERIYVTLQKITSFGIKIESPTASTFKMDDPTDRIFYDTAKYCNAILITGNLKHYPRESFVMNPNDFLRRFNERENRRADFSR